jgi:DNA-binding NarL/FixJ family response regulator
MEKTKENGTGKPEEPSSVTTSVFVVAETRLYREGVAGLLAEQQDLEVVGTAGTVRRGLTLIGALRPDVVLLDIEIENSLTAVREICLPRPQTKVIALAIEDKTAQIVNCAEAGVTGFVTHDGSLDDLLDAIRSVRSGELRCSPKIAAALANRVASLAREPGAAMGVHCLTAREMEVIRLIEQGLSNKEIANKMCIGVTTVKNHVHHILNKLNVRRRGQAAALVRVYY